MIAGAAASSARQRLQRRIATGPHRVPRAASEATASAAPPARPATRKVRREVIARDGRTRRRDAASHRARDARSGLVNLVRGVRRNNLIGRVRRLARASARLAGCGTASGAPVAGRPLLHHGCHDPARERHPRRTRSLRELARVQRAARRAAARSRRSPARSTGSRNWQARRLRRDVRRSRRAAALYRRRRVLPDRPLRRRDFAQRDADLARVVPMMVRMLPERVIATIALAMEVNALSQELDRALLARLPRADGRAHRRRVLHARTGAMGNRPAARAADRS